MPIYEYRCSACGHELEALQKLSEARLVNCPACHADALVKKVSAAGFQLKGSGWYATDFRNGNKTAPAPATDAKSDDKPATSDAAATESKSDAKSDAKSDTSAKPETVTKPAGTRSESASAKAATTPTTGSSSS